MRRRLAVWLVALVALAACGAPEREPPGGEAQTRIEPSGFLGDYSKLKPGRGDQAQLVYIDPEADFSGYARVIVDPVVVWPGAADPTRSEEEIQGLADRLGHALRVQLGLEFDVVEEPSPGTLRIRSAITAIRASGVSAEIEVLDAASGRRLVAAADARSREEVGAGGEAAGAEAAFTRWASRISLRLATFRDFDAAEASFETSQPESAGDEPKAEP